MRRMMVLVFQWSKVMAVRVTVGDGVGVCCDKV